MITLKSITGKAIFKEPYKHTDSDNIKKGKVYYFNHNIVIISYRIKPSNHTDYVKHIVNDRVRYMTYKCVIKVIKDYNILYCTSQLTNKQLIELNNLIL